MAFLQLIINMVAFGAILWVINTYVPMSEAIKKVVNAILTIVAIIFVLSAFGFFGPL